MKPVKACIVSVRKEDYFITGLSEDPEIDILLFAANILEFVGFLLEHDERPDVVLLDITIPHLNIAGAVDFLRSKSPRLKIILLVGYSRVEKAIEGVGVEVDGIIYNSSEFHTAVSAITQHGHFFSKEFIRDLAGKGYGFEQQYSRSVVELSAIELRVLKLICDDKTNVEISKIVDRSVRSVEATRKRLHTKTKTRKTAGLVRFALKEGIISF